MCVQSELSGRKFRRHLAQLEKNTLRQRMTDAVERAIEKIVLNPKAGASSVEVGTDIFSLLCSK